MIARVLLNMLRALSWVMIAPVLFVVLYVLGAVLFLGGMDNDTVRSFFKRHFEKDA